MTNSGRPRGLPEASLFRESSSVPEAIKRASPQMKTCQEIFDCGRNDSTCQASYQSTEPQLGSSGSGINEDQAALMEANSLTWTAPDMRFSLPPRHLTC